MPSVKLHVSGKDGAATVELDDAYEGLTELNSMALGLVSQLLDEVKPKPTTISKPRVLVADN